MLPLIMKSEALAPPLVRFTGPLVVPPLFTTVNICGAVLPAVTTSAKVNGEGETSSVAGATAVAVNGIESEPPGMPDTSRLAIAGPALAGWKVMPT